MLTRTRRAWTRGAVSLLALLAAPGLTAREQDPLPSGADLVAKYVAAIGGADAWRGVTSLRAVGRTELPAQNLRGTFEMVSARPARLVLRMDLAGIGKAESGFNGDVGWTIDPMVGPALVTGGPLAEMKNDAHFDAALHPPELITSVVTTARVEFDGRPAYKAAVTYVSGQQRDEFFDVETGLMIGSEGISETPMGKMPLKVTLRDYKPFGNIRQPTRLIQASMGLEQHFVIESLELNVVKPDAFEPPPVIRAMIKTEPDEPWRAAAVASFDEAWTTIHESFYDPSFGGLDWEGVRASLRPRVRAASDPEAARGVIREMLATLKRSHFALLSSSPTAGEPAPTGEALVAIDTRMVAGAVVITDVRPGTDAARVGLTPGQIVLGIDDESAAEWTAGTNETDPRIVATTTWRRVQRALRGPDRSEARLRISEHGRERVIVTRRSRPEGDRVVFGDLPPFFVQVRDYAVKTPAGHSVGVIGFNVWMTSANDLVAAAIDRHRSASGLVLDLRGNPGGLAAMIQGVAGHVFNERAVLGRMKTRTSDLEFFANPRVVMPDGRRVTPFAGPLVVLVDELTASASECFAGGLQSLGRARIVGRTTAGQALPASIKRLPNGDLLMYVVGDFVTATGRRLEGDGVVPDDRVSLEPGVLLAGRDPDLEAALRWIDQKI